MEVNLGQKISRLLALLIVFCVPLFFAFYPQTVNVFELPKFSLFAILLAWLWLVIIAGRGVARYAPTMTYFRHPVLLAAFAWLAWSAVSTFLSLDPGTSFWGGYEWQDGLLQRTAFFLWFLAVVNCRGIARNARVSPSQPTGVARYAPTVAASALLVALYALAQSRGYDFFVWAESIQDRVTSTVGQPNFLAAYFLFSLPLTVWGLRLSLRAKRSNPEAAGKTAGLLRRLRPPRNDSALIFLALSALAQVGGLIVTYSLSAWLGVIAGLAVVGVVYLSLRARRRSNPDADGRTTGLLRRLRPPRNDIVYPLLAIIALFSIMALAANSGTLRAKLKATVNLQGSSSTSVRFNFWQASWQGIQDMGVKNLLFGHGLETQSEIIGNHYEPDWAVSAVVNVRDPRAHNIFLDTLLTQGIIGLLAWLMLYGAVLWTVIRNILKDNERALNYALLFSFTAWLVFLQFQFTEVVTSVFFWLFAGLAAGTGRICHAGATEGSDSIPFFNAFTRRLGILSPALGGLQDDTIYTGRSVYRLTFFLLGLGGVLLISWWSLTNIINDYYYREILVAQRYKQFFGALDLHRFIQSGFARHEHYDKEFALLLASWIQEFPKGFFDLGAARLKEILPLADRDHFSDRWLRARINGSLTRYYPEYFEAADREYAALAEMAPRVPKIYLFWADLYNSRGDKERAEELYLKTLSLIPPLDTPGMNDKFTAINKGYARDIYRSLVEVAEEENRADYEKRLGELENIQ